MNQEELNNFSQIITTLIDTNIEKFRDFIIEPENLKKFNDPIAFNVKNSVRWELLFTYIRGKNDQALIKSLYKFLYENEIYNDVEIAYN